MTATHDDLRAQVSAYFDGELPPADEPAVVEHLATCDECQELLGDTVGLHAAVARGPKVEAAAPVPARAPRRMTWLLAGAVAAAAAALVVVWRTGHHRPAPRSVAMADHRTIEVRLSGGPFADHRPYEVPRGGVIWENIPLATLAELERVGDPATLAAALMSAGELDRARTILAAMPPSPAVDGDRAALALLDHDAEAALASADRAIRGGVVAAHWNRALALRELGFPLAAAAAFEAAAKLGDGWSEEAKQRAKALRDDFARQRAAIDDVVKRGAAMVAGGPPLTAADVAIAPGPARKAFHDALRGAADPASVDALLPLADALDAETRPAPATARPAAEAVRRADFAVRRPLALRYRAIAARTASADETAALLRDLERAGAAVDDLRLGALVLTSTGPDRLARLEPLLAGRADPWFALLLVHERVNAERATARDRAEADATAGLRDCEVRTRDYRCAVLERDLGELVAERGAIEEGSTHLARAVAGFASSGDAVWEDNTRVSAADVARVRSAWSVARAGYDEVRARAGDAMPCFNRRTMLLGLAEVARFQGELELARAAIPDPTSCGSVPDPQSLITVVDLARQTGDPADRARALAWIEAARPGGGPVLAIAEGRLELDVDPARARTILAPSLSTLAGDVAARNLAYRSLASAAGMLGDWKAVLDDADRELGRAGAPCEVVVNAEETDLTVAARGASGDPTGARVAISLLGVDDARVPQPIVDAVAGCPTVAVIARPPLHGRSALLPAIVPWAFVAADRPVAGPSAPRAIVVADTEPPAADVKLPRLAPTDFPADAVAITGTAATPSRVLAELATATYAELHAHGVANLAEPGTSFLALSPDADGTWQLTAAAVAKAKLDAHPVIVLGACKAAATTPRWDARWSLPDAFLTAGARAVIAADVDLPDREAAALFAKLRARIAKGEAPAAALAAERSAAVAAGQAWAAHLMVFE